MSQDIVATMVRAADLLEVSSAQTEQVMALLEASQERERVNMRTISELTLALRVQEQDLREANARIRAMERANGAN